MFNRTFVEGDTNVHVQQQPNDAADAARLHGEIRAKAEAEATEAVIAKFGARNEMTGVVIRALRTYIDDKQHIRLLFKLNGQAFDIQVEDTYESMTLHAYQEVVRKLMGNVLQKMLTPEGFNCSGEGKKHE